jgi:hypothetical protein
VSDKYCHNKQLNAAGVTGLALSCDASRLYWSPLRSHKIYAIETDLLLMYEPGHKAIFEGIVHLGNKTTASAGLGCTSQSLMVSGLDKGQLFTVNERDLDKTIGSGKNISLEEGTFNSMMKPLLTGDAAVNIYPASVGYSEGWVYLLTNNMCEFLEGTMNFTSDNYFIQRVFLDEKPYYLGCKVDYSLGMLEYILLGVSGGIFGILLILVIVIGRCWKSKPKRDEAYTQLD